MTDPVKPAPVPRPHPSQVGAYGRFDEIVNRYREQNKRQVESIDRLLADLSALKAACTCGAEERVMSASEADSVASVGKPARGSRRKAAKKAKEGHDD